jgi:CHASE2 domain-containing sensor protein
MSTPFSLPLAAHVALSLIGIVSGIVVFRELLNGAPARGWWTELFLCSTILTSLTGFPLPPFGFDPPRAIGVVSLALLAIAVIALYVFRLARRWGPIYVVSAVAALYLNVFVGVAQAFKKVPALTSLAPTQSEPPFLISQLIVLVAFLACGFLAIRNVHPRAEA